MVQKINFNSNERINFGSVDGFLPTFQQNREHDLQTRAGLEPSGAYEEVRRMLATRQEENSLSELYTASESALAKGAIPETVAKYIEKYTPEVTREDLDIALEKAAADKQVQEAFQDNEKTAINNSVDNIDPTEDYTKQELFTTFLTNLRGWAQNQSFAKKFGGFVRTVFDPQFHQNAVERDYFVKGSGVLKTAEGATQEVTDAVLVNWRNMTAADFKTYLDTTYDNIIRQNPNTWMLEEMCDNLETGSTDLQEFMGWADVAAVGIGAVKNTYKAAKAVGNVRKTQALAKKAVETLDTTTLVEEVITPTVTKPIQNPMEIAKTGDVADDVVESLIDRRATQILQKAHTQGVYSDAEIKLMKDQEEKVLGTLFKHKPIDPVDIAIVEDRDGSLKTVVLFGAEDGSAMTRQQAFNLAERLGYTEGEFSVVSKDAAGYYVQTIKDTSLSAKGAANKAFTDADAVKEFTDEWSVKMSPLWQKTKVESIVNGATRMFAGVYKKGKEAAERVELATRAQGGIKRFISTEYRSSFNALNKKENAIFKELYLKGQKADSGHGKWFSVKELEEANIPAKVIKAYQDFKTVNDMEYLLTNENVRKKLVRAGYKKYGNVYGKEVSIYGINKNNIRVLDDQGKVIEDVTKYADKGDYKLIQVSRMSANQADLDCTHMLFKSADAAGEELPQFVTKYTPGGRRAYTRGTSFVKVGRGWINPETGTKLNGFAKTLVAGYDRKQLQQYADEVNKAIEIFKSVSGFDEVHAAIRAQEALDDANFKLFKVSSWDELKGLIKNADNPKGIIDPDFKAQVVQEGFGYEYGNGLATASDELGEVDTAFQELLDNRSKFSRHRTNLLDDINGDTVRLVDVEEIYDRTINKAANIGANSDLIAWYSRQLERFQRVSTNYKDLAGMTDMDKINRIEFDLARRSTMSADELALLRSGQRFVEHARGILNSKTAADMAVENFMYRAAEALDITGARGKWFDAVADFKPAKFARALSFNAYMGWWNPAQLIKQGIGVMNVASLEPVRAVKGMLSYIPIRLARSTEKGSEAYKIYKNMAIKVAGLTDDEFEGLMKFMSKYDVEGSSGLMVGADKAYGSALKADKNLLKRLWDSQYWFMKEGNAANYYIADIASWLRHNDDLKAGKIKSFTDKDIALYSNDLFINMTRTSESAFQRGTIIPGTEMIAQWMSYPMRMMEAMLNSRLSFKQKAALLGTQLSLWGVAGTFGDDETSYNMYKGLTKYGINPELAEKLTDGFLGYVGKELGVVFDEGIAVKEQFKRLFAFYDAARGEINFSNIPAAKGPLHILAMLKAVNEVINPSLGDRDVYRYMKFLQSQPHLPSAFKNVTKAAIALKYGKFYDKYGDILVEDATKTQAIWQALGFRPYESKLENYAYEAMTNRQQVIDDFMSDINECIETYRHHAIENSSPEKMLELEEAFNTEFTGLLSLIDEFDDGYVKKEILDMVTKKLYRMQERLADERENKLNENFTQLLKNVILRKTEEISNGLYE